VQFMVVMYHRTDEQNAARIAREGFRLESPHKGIWLADTADYWLARKRKGGLSFVLLRLTLLEVTLDSSAFLDAFEMPATGRVERSLWYEGVVRTADHVEPSRSKYSSHRRAEPAAEVWWACPGRLRTCYATASALKEFAAARVRARPQFAPRASHSARGYSVAWETIPERRRDACRGS
jgi:hypothetical protein